MKFATTVILSTIAAVSAKSINVGDSLTVNSALGKQLLSKATRVEGERRLEEDEELSAWVVNYSIKFQGCHHLVQWNAEADGNEDVRLYKKRLVRFRLCPSDSCSADDAGGCKEGFGEYIIDMQTYLNAYYESKMQTAEEECKEYSENYCSCEGNGDDGFNENKCAYDCVVAAGMTQCYQYMEDMIYQDIFQPANYMQCAQWKYGDRRQLNNNNNQNAYYIGPYCAMQGGAIHFGMFSDDACTISVEDGTYGAYTFETQTGIALPYSSKSIVGSECESCLMVDANAGDDQAAEPSEACEQTYMNAGKCETYLAEGVVTTKNEQACTYIEGIKVVREDGMVFYKEAHANAVSTAFVVIFAVAFFAMGFYVWYLRTRLNIRPDSLL